MTGYEQEMEILYEAWEKGHLADSDAAQRWARLHKRYGFQAYLNGEEVTWARWLQTLLVEYDYSQGGQL